MLSSVFSQKEARKFKNSASSTFLCYISSPLFEKSCPHDDRFVPDVSMSLANGIIRIFYYFQEWGYHCAYS